MKGFYRVSAVVTYLPGHPIYEARKKRAGQYWVEEKEVTENTYDRVVADGVEHACVVVRRHYENAGAAVKRVHQVVHLGDITIDT